MSEKVTPNKRKTHLPNREISFVVYLTRVLKQVHPDAGITKVAIFQINSILNYVARTVNSVCTRLLELDDRKTVTTRDVQNAIRVVFPGELLKHAVSESTKAVTNRNFSHTVGEPNKKIASNVRAGLLFSVSKTRKFFTQERIGSGAAVYLAGTLEYLASELLELSGKSAMDHKKVRITTRHLFLAIENDEELKKLLDRVGIVIASGGVVPTLEKIERHYRKDKKTNKMIAISGTRAQQDIKAQQDKYGSVDFAKAPFERLVRILVNTQKEGSGLSPDAALALQVAVEGKTLEIFQSALAVSKLSKRQKVTSLDFNTALAIMKVETVNVHSSLIKDQQFVVKAAIKRLAHKAGIKLLSGKIYDDVRAFIHGFTNLIVTKAAISMLSCRRKRLSLTDVLFGLETFGIKLAYTPKKKKAPKPT